VINCTRVLF